MAIVFVSPKQRQKMFFIGITALFLLFLLAFSLFVFLSKPSKVAGELVFPKTKIDIDFSILSSDLVKNLEKVDPIEKQFEYIGKDKKGKAISGQISAPSEEIARKMLEAMDYSISEIKEVKIGRENPFEPY